MKSGKGFPDFGYSHLDPDLVWTLSCGRCEYVGTVEGADDLRMLAQVEFYDRGWRWRDRRASCPTCSE